MTWSRERPPVSPVAISGVGGLAQRGQARHALLDGQQPGEHGHGVRRRAQRDPAVGAGLAAPRRCSRRGRSRRPASSPVASACPNAIFSSPASASCLSTAWRWAGSRWLVWATTASASRSLIRPAANNPRIMRQVGGQGAGDASVAGSPAIGRDVRGQGDLVGDPAAQLLRVQAPRGDQLGLLVDLGRARTRPWRCAGRRPAPRGAARAPRSGRPAPRHRQQRRRRPGRPGASASSVRRASIAVSSALTASPTPHHRSNSCSGTERCTL